MRAVTCHRHRTALGLTSSLVISAILAGLALVPATAAAAGAPVIESIGSGYGAEVTVGAKINPEGLETTYEIGLECSPCGSGDQWTAGTLPAVLESREVTLALTGLQAGRRYRFDVRAVNADGKTWRQGETLEAPPTLAPFPNGTGGSGVVEAPYLGADSEQLNQIAEHEAQQRAKEQEEQKAKEAAERPVTETAKAEEQAHVRLQSKLATCLVPALEGDTLSVARRALHSAHCQLGAVRRPPHHHGALRVSAQSAPAGKRLAHEARVALTLGVKRAVV
jgi:hypothetical protein